MVDLVFDSCLLEARVFYLLTDIRLTSEGSCAACLLSPQAEGAEAETCILALVLVCLCSGVCRMIIQGAESLTFVIICLRHLN